MKKKRLTEETKHAASAEPHESRARKEALANSGVNVEELEASQAERPHNTAKVTSGMTTAFEASATSRPSRKSTRKSANGAKAATALSGRTKARATSPQSRHAHR
ncbi:MAG: hypothetical protein SF187_25410 [Deltaproteobacteria bacterium]|nr:hypothetical protein [Deltaproteobacteria bacterium]